MAISIFAGVNFNGGELGGAVIPPTAGNGTYTGEIRRNPATWIVEIWNGTAWITPVSSGSLPTGTANSMLKYNATSGVWENAPYLTYTGTKFRHAYNGSTTVYAEIGGTSATNMSLRLQTSPANYALLSSATCPSLQLAGSVATNTYSIKVGTPTVYNFSVTNQGDIVGKTLRLTDVAAVIPESMIGIGTNGDLTDVSFDILATAMGVTRLDLRTIFVSHEFPTPSIDNRRFGSIVQALAYAGTFSTSELWNIVLLAGIYSETIKIAPNITLICAEHVKIRGCVIQLLQGAKFLGHADVEIDNAGIIHVVSEIEDNNTLTVIEGNELAVKTVGVPLHIRCNTLTEFVATVGNDYALIPYTSKFNVKIECLNICQVITTQVPYSLLSTLRAMPYISNNLYCQCKWSGDEPLCSQQTECLMRWNDLDSSDYRKAEDSRVTIRTNTRDPYSEFLIAVGKVSMLGLVHDSVIETPANYVTSATYGSEDVPRTQLNIHGFRENYSSLGTAYQVANEGTLVLDSCNIRAANGGARVVYQKVDGTTYTCRTSVKNSYLEGGAYDVESATSDRLAIVASMGCNGESGSTTLISGWFTAVGINWI